MIKRLVGRYQRPIRQLALLFGEKGCRILIVALVGTLVARTLCPYLNRLWGALDWLHHRPFALTGSFI